VMTRGTFANIKLFNKFIGKPAPKTIHFPSGQTVRMCPKCLGVAHSVTICIKGES
jgi:aconitase A